MRAVLVVRDKRIFDDGTILEITVWRVPRPVPGSGHEFKYSLFYGDPGRRLLGYDNERGKGDHMHRLGREEPYTFVSLERLLDDFQAVVEAMRGEPI